MLKINLDTDDAHRALDELIEKMRTVDAARSSSAVRPDPAEVVQAQRRWNRRNGIVT